MTRSRLLFLTAVAALLPALARAQDPAPAAAAALPPLSEIAKALASPNLDVTRSVSVSGLQVGADAMDITLESGHIYFSKPWREGEPPSHAIWEGTGKARLVPVTSLEKHEFEKVWNGRPLLEETITAAYLRFDDDFWDRLKGQVKPDTAAPALAALFHERVRAEGEVQVDLNEPFVRAAIERAMMPGTPRAPGAWLVSFRIGTGKGDWLDFVHDPTAAEENALFRHQKITAADAQYGKLPILSVWNDKEDYESGADLEAEDKDQFELVHSDADFTVLKTGLLLDATTATDVRGRYPNVWTLTFDLVRYGDFISKEKQFLVRSVTTADGRPLDYLHTDAGHLLVRLDTPLRRNELRRILVSYTADFIRPNPSISNLLPPGTDVPSQLDALDAESKTFTLLNTFPWFPQSGYLKRITFDWRLRVPKPYVAVASGTTLERREENGMNLLHTASKEPVLLASWLFGSYEIYTDPADTARPKIYVAGLFKQKKAPPVLYHEARNIITWYEQKFTPFPYDELDIAQMGFFYGFGQAPPGLVQLTGESFLSQGELAQLGADPAFIYAFLAHEIGHEWFAHVVAWVSYHDQWLSESYTEYISGLYVAERLGLPAFETKLRDWKTNALSVPDGGTIWLGQRLGKDYIKTTYSKGPYVLHMLRLSMQAEFGPVEGEKMFFSSLRNFLTAYRHKNTTTNELVAVIQRTTGRDYGPFFNQWFRSPGVPEMKVRYTVRDTEDGKFLVSVTASQAAGETAKQFFLPIGFQFGSKTITRMMAVAGPEASWQVKLPEKPDKVIINLDDGALARVKVEKG